MKYNKSETVATKKSGGISTVGVGNTGTQNTVSLNNEEAQRGSERASEVVVVVD